MALSFGDIALSFAGGAADEFNKKHAEKRKQAADIEKMKKEHKLRIKETLEGARIQQRVSDEEYNKQITAAGGEGSMGAAHMFYKDLGWTPAQITQAYENNLIPKVTFRELTSSKYIDDNETILISQDTSRVAKGDKRIAAQVKDQAPGSVVSPEVKQFSEKNGVSLASILADPKEYGFTNVPNVGLVRTDKTTGEVSTVVKAPGKARSTEKDANGVLRYIDNGELVFPEVKKQKTIEDSKIDHDKGVVTFAYDDGTAQTIDLPDLNENQDIEIHQASYDREAGGFSILNKDGSSTFVKTEGLGKVKDTDNYRLTTLESRDEETGQTKKEFIIYEINDEGKMNITDIAAREVTPSGRTQRGAPQPTVNDIQLTLKYFEGLEGVAGDYIRGLEENMRDKAATEISSIDLGMQNNPAFAKMSPENRRRAALSQWWTTQRKRAKAALLQQREAEQAK